MAGGDFKFNLQEFLADMREEQRSEMRALGGKVDTLSYQLHGRISAVQTKVNDHETRIVVVENTRKMMRWLAGTAIVALLGGVVEFVFNHLPKLRQ